MRKLSALFFIIIIGIYGCKRTKEGSPGVTIGHQTESKAFPYIISNGRLGTISVGDGFDSTIKNLETWFVIEKDSMPSCECCTTYTPIFLVRSKESNQNLFSIEPGWEENNRDKVFRIMTSSQSFKTDKGIKVGMTLKDIKQAYEVLKVSFDGELGIHIIVKEFNGSFGIESPNMDEWWSFNASTISDSLKITEIIII
jgi:hypothetical protein